MKVCIEQFLGGNHSWSVCGHNLAHAFITQGHEVHLRSTNGYEHFPNNLTPYIKEKLDYNYDLQLSYTAMLNFAKYLSHGNKNRFGIWNYEFDILPFGMAKYVNCVDKFLPSSNFFYDICIKNNIPKEKMAVIPHGVDWNKFQNAIPLELKTDKKYKLLINFGQPHIRKNIAGTLEAFGRAFSKKDDVCLVIKAVDKIPSAAFEVSFKEIYNNFNKKFPSHGECLIITEFIPEIERLYKSCDILFMLPHAEAFFFFQHLKCLRLVD